MAASRYSRLKLGIVGVAAASMIFGAAYFQSSAVASGPGALQASSAASANSDLVTFSATSGSVPATANQTAKNVTTTRAKTTRGS